MIRTMIDCTGANAATVSRLDTGASVIGWYGTGTSQVQWTEADRKLWPLAAKVEIDQGYQSPDITVATVRDVEPECWETDNAVKTENWTAERPTIYCDADDLPGVVAAGWKGDLWLALPGWKTGDALPDHGDCTVVAVQTTENVNGLYDVSLVLDDWWPEKPVASQGDWAWCSKCQGLFFGPNESISACVRGGTHARGGDSYVYAVDVTGLR